MRSHEYNKRLYDKCKADIDFHVGDSVYVDNGNKLNRSKLDCLRVGPFTITNQLSNNVYEITIDADRTGKRLYHASKLLKHVM